MAVATATRSGPIRVVPADIGRFNAALDSQAEVGTTQNLFQRTTSRAREQANAMLEWLRSTKPYQWVRNLFSTVGRQVRAAASKLGRLGLLATGLMVVSSKTGQKAIGTLARWARKAVKGVMDFAFACVSKPLSWFGFTKGASEAVQGAKQWIYDRAHDFWYSDLAKKTRRVLRYDGVIGHNVQLISRPVALVSLAIAFLSGGWMYAGIAGAAAVSLPHSARSWIKGKAEFLHNKAEETVSELKDENRPDALKTETGQRAGGRIIGKTVGYLSTAKNPEAATEEHMKTLRGIVIGDFRSLLGKARGEKAFDLFYEAGSKVDDNFGKNVETLRNDGVSPQKLTAARDQVEAFLEQCLITAVQQASA